MAEIEYGGIKVGVLNSFVLPLIGTLGGGLWAGFEFYKDYMNMKEQIIVAPDLSEFDKRLAVLKEECKQLEKRLLSFVMQSVNIDFRDIKNGLKR